MKIWKLYILTAMALMSCSREMDLPDEQPAPAVDIEGMPVTITFSVAGPPVDVSTKADGDGLDSDSDGGLETLHLAVFGGSGYLKEYVQANPLDKAANYYSYSVEKKVQKTNENNQKLYYKYETDPDTGEDSVSDEEVTKEELDALHLDPDYPVLVMKMCERSVPVYTYTVTLALSNSPRTIHFLGNGPSTLPFGWDSDVIPVQLSQLRKYTEEGSEEEKSLKAKAYWQMRDFPDGITAKKESMGKASYYVSPHGYHYGISKEEDALFFNDGGFQIEEDVEARFNMIPLIRNWAKVVLYSLPKRQSHFEAISLAVINVPSRGSLAPYSAATKGFVKGYEELGFDDLQKMKYPASLPAKTVFDNSVPAPSEFVPDPANVNQFNDGSRVARASTLETLYSETDTDESAVYLYERPAPSDKIPPSYVIIYGKYYEDPNDPDDEGYPCYYKVDLMETVDVLDSEGEATGVKESRYYPIFRNFKYQIWVSKILSKGHDTPQAAAVSAGSADVSADISTGHLSDISDGVGRLHLTWMAKTYSNTEDFSETTLDVLYSDPSGNPHMGTTMADDYYVMIEPLPPSDGKGDLIKDLTLLPPSQGETGTSSQGWRQIRFTVKKYEGKVARSQTIRVSGIHPSGRIYRDVIVSVLPKQPMKVTCSPVRVLAKKGESVDVSFKIPDGLLQSMFPLEFTIEADRMTLTPDLSENMPVSYSTSVSLDDGFKNKQAFHFIRTLTWDEYSDYEKYPAAMDEDERLWRTITCHFKTNCEDNYAKVWVANEFFILDDNASASFENYELKEFRDLTFPGYIPRMADQPIGFTFNVTPNGTDGNGHSTYPEITISLSGLTIDPDQSPLELVSAGVYTYKPTASHVELTFYTRNDSGENIRVTLEAEDYYPQYLEPFHFNTWLPDGSYVPSWSYGLLEGLFTANVYSNVAYGRVESGLQYNGNKKERNVILGYFDDPQKLYPAVELVLDGHLAKVDNKSFPFPPSGPTYSDGYKNYHEVLLKTPTSTTPSYDDITLSLKAPGYVTEEFTTYERLNKSRLHTFLVNIKDTKDWFNPEGEHALKFVPKTKTDDSYFHLLIEPQDDAPDPFVADDVLYLGCDADTKTGPCEGGSYKLTFISGDVELSFGKDSKFKAQRFYTCFFTFASATALPAAVVTEDGMGTCHLYPGSNKVYHWIAFDDKNEYPGHYSSENWSPATFEKSIIFTAGQAQPIRLTSFMYKALSEVGK